jgi:hypothetical protein
MTNPFAFLSARYGRRRGTGSFIELITAAVIIFVGVLSTIMVLRMSHKEWRVSREYILGGSLAMEILGKVKVMPYQEVPQTQGFVDASTIASLLPLLPVPPELPEVSRTISVQNENTIKIIRVAVSWKTLGKESQDASSHCEYICYKTPSL